MRTITLNTKQQRGVEILTRLDAGALEVGAAAELLGVTPRQVRRLRARFRQEGFGAVVQGNRGRASDPVPPKPRREMVRQPRPVDPKATARRRGWLFAQG